MVFQCWANNILSQPALVSRLQQLQCWEAHHWDLFVAWFMFADWSWLIILTSEAAEVAGCKVDKKLQYWFIWRCHWSPGIEVTVDSGSQLHGTAWFNRFLFKSWGNYNLILSQYHHEPKTFLKNILMNLSRPWQHLLSSDNVSIMANDDDLLIDLHC